MDKISHQCLNSPAGAKIVKPSTCYNEAYLSWIKEKECDHSKERPWTKCPKHIEYSKYSDNRASNDHWSEQNHIKDPLTII
jgi:hypothetical protein